MSLFNPITKFVFGKSREEGSMSGRRKVRVSPNNAAIVRRPAEKGRLVENSS